MQDRLFELTGGAPHDADLESGRGGTVGSRASGATATTKASNATMATDATDASGAGVSGDAPFMTDFFTSVGTIKSLMSVIKKNVRTIEEKQGESLATISAEAAKKMTDELDKLITSTNQVAAQVSGMLKDLEASNRVHAQNPTAETRIRINMHGTLTKKFVDLMTDYQEVQTKYKNKNRERMERQYKIVNPGADESQVDEALDSLGTGDQQQIFAEQILSTGHMMARNAVADIQERHREIVMLEASIAELHQLFLDMAVLVESQGELLDQIEYNVASSVTATDRGVTQLAKAVKIQKSTRKKVCCLIGILGAVITGILIVGSFN